MTMPAFFFNTDQYIHGIVMANYTSGAPVRGNLTIKATVRPIQPIRPKKFYRNPNDNFDPYNPYENQYGNPYNNPEYPYQVPEYENAARLNKPIVEKYFNFVSFISFSQTPLQFIFFFFLG